MEDEDSIPSLPPNENMDDESAETGTTQFSGESSDTTGTITLSSYKTTIETPEAIVNDTQQDGTPSDDNMSVASVDTEMTSNKGDSGLLSSADNPVQQSSIQALITTEKTQGHTIIPLRTEELELLEHPSHNTPTSVPLVPTGTPLVQSILHMPLAPNPMTRVRNAINPTPSRLTAGHPAPTTASSQTHIVTEVRNETFQSSTVIRPKSRLDKEIKLKNNTT
jgi:hypothetical protein